MGEYAVFKPLVHNIQSRQLPDSRKDPKLLQGKKNTVTYTLQSNL